MTKANQPESERSEIMPGVALTSVFFKGAEIWLDEDDRQVREERRP